MHLKGWTNPLPDWMVDAIDKGVLTVHEGKDFQYLQGTVMNPQGTLITFK